MTTSKSLDGVNTELRQRVELLLKALPTAYVSSAYRSKAEQQRLYDGWVAGLPGFAPANRPGTSQHELGLAVDVACPYELNLKRATLGALYGLYTPHSTEPWHFELYPLRKPLQQSPAKVITQQPLGDEDMSDAFVVVWNDGSKGVGDKTGAYANLGGPFYGNPLGLKPTSRVNITPTSLLGVTAVDPADSSKGYVFYNSGPAGTEEYRFDAALWAKIQKGEA